MSLFSKVKSKKITDYAIKPVSEDKNIEPNSNPPVTSGDRLNSNPNRTSLKRPISPTELINQDKGAKQV